MRLIIKTPRVNSSKFLLWIALVMTIVSETLISANVLRDSNITKVVQYIIILTPLGFNFLILAVNSRGRKEKLLFTEEIRTMIILIAILGCLSLYKSVTARKFAFNSIMELIQIILPFVFTFFMLNRLTCDEIASFMKIALICTIIGYLISTDFGSITMEDLARMLVVGTYSPFENSAFAEVASGLGAYFIYYRKKMPVYAFLAVILNLLCWKRVLVLMTLTLLIICLIGKGKEVLKRRTVLLISIAWAVIVFLTFCLYQREAADYIRETYNINLESFTVYRIYRLWYCYEKGFQSYGLGSTSNFIYSFGRYLGCEFEMDFIRIMFEVGPIAILAICYAYFKITRRNKYSCVMICFCFLNLLMANGLLRYWGYTFRIITIAVINYYDNDKNLRNLKPYSGFRIRRGEGSLYVGIH